MECLKNCCKRCMRCRDPNAFFEDEDGSGLEDDNYTGVALRPEDFDVSVDVLDKEDDRIIRRRSKSLQDEEERAPPAAGESDDEVDDIDIDSEHYNVGGESDRDAGAAIGQNTSRQDYGSAMPKGGDLEQGQGINSAIASPQHSSDEEKSHHSRLQGARLKMQNAARLAGGLEGLAQKGKK
ncbi:unnamed protein product [Amoebophrya sp. A25]|nr:unnamed protein product [Amoebophrya sp. A25]|eukprot:GSA25T00007058001.1